MTTDPSPSRFSDAELALLRPLARQFPTIDAVVAELARLAAELTLPKGTIHIISDIHGEDAKLRHVLNNASGTLRPLVEGLFAGQFAAAEIKEILSLLFYPHETLQRLEPELAEDEPRRRFVRKFLRQISIIIRSLAQRYSLNRTLAAFPSEFGLLLQEVLYEREGEPRAAYIEALLESLVRHGRAFRVVEEAVHVVRNLAVDELIIAGDIWDRGPRGDRVLDYIRQQPNVSITWGNHDAAWLGAALGLNALVAHVLRISIRYRRLTQLEEGYGITIQPLEHLARTVYGDDPAECYLPKGEGLRDRLQMARMHKAAALMQFKLEGQMIARHPDWAMDNRRLLHRINRVAGTVEIDGGTHPLRDAHFPTLDPSRPYELSEEEQVCLDRIRQSFMTSRTMRMHMEYLVGHGSMYLRRDRHLIFHGCVPVDEHGEFLPFTIDGTAYRGRELFEAIERVVARCLDRPDGDDLDLLWYLWCGPRSPLFGKDRITTFENDLIADPATHVETKNAYFQLIHERLFCRRILEAFGVDPEQGLIVNGHVPVKIEAGESPLKRSGQAITIDGAFSEAYGDYGYTLVLEPDQTLLARHHHFESVEAAVRDGVDIIPAIQVIRQWQPPHRVADTETGAQVRSAMAMLERLLTAYQCNKLRQEESARGDRTST